MRGPSWRDQIDPDKLDDAARRCYWGHLQANGEKIDGWAIHAVWADVDANTRAFWVEVACQVWNRFNPPGLYATPPANSGHNETTIEHDNDSGQPVERTKS